MNRAARLVVLSVAAIVAVAACSGPGASTGVGGGGGSFTPATPCRPVGTTAVVVGCLPPKAGCDVYRTWPVRLSEDAGTVCGAPAAMALSLGPTPCLNPFAWLPIDAGCIFAVGGSQTTVSLASDTCTATYTAVNLTLSRTDAGLVGSGRVDVSGPTECHQTLIGVRSP